MLHPSTIAYTCVYIHVYTFFKFESSKHVYTNTNGRCNTTKRARRRCGTYSSFVYLQVSSNAGMVSHFVNLQIVVPEATIQGGSGEHHVDVGSVIDLVCIIDKVSFPFPLLVPLHRVLDELLLVNTLDSPNWYCRCRCRENWLSICKYYTVRRRMGSEWDE